MTATEPAPDALAPLDQAFFARATPIMARELLGRYVVHASRPGRRAGPSPGGTSNGAHAETRMARIVETEAYLDASDPGSHARRGRHTQAGRLWERPGTAYVYVCYGIHDMLNVVAHGPDGVGAVLIRAAEPVAGHDALRDARPGTADARLMAGPGNLCTALGVTRDEHDGIELTAAADPPLWLAHGVPTAPEHIAATGRIGLTHGGELLLRYADATSPSVSRPVPDPGALEGRATDVRIHNR